MEKSPANGPPDLEYLIARSQFTQGCKLVRFFFVESMGLVYLPKLMVDFYGKCRVNISYMHGIGMQFLMEQNFPFFQLFGVAYHLGQPAANLHVEIIVASHLPVRFCFVECVLVSSRFCRCFFASL